MALGANSRTLSGCLSEMASAFGEDLAVVDALGDVTFAELFARSSRLADRLRKLGVGRGARVGLLAGNEISWLEVMFGTHLAGATLVPLSTWSTTSELEFLVEDSAIEILFAVSEFSGRDFSADLVSFAQEGLKIVLLAAHPSPEFVGYDDFLGDADAAEYGNAAMPEDDALVLYTSGSTSIPKGVRLPHFAVTENGFNIGERQGLKRQDKVFLPAPLFWAYGGANALPATLTHGGTLVLQEKFDAEDALDAIERNRCTAIYTLPAMTNALVRHSRFAPDRVASLRTGLTIGSEEEFLFAAEKLGVPELCNIYGATETCGNCAVTWHHWPLERRATTQGTMLPGQELRIRDLQTGEIIPSDRPGLLEVKGYTTPGYSGKSAELNDQAFTSDGFYRTGDIGFLDPEGALVFVGRHSEMIKRAGINVSPAEIEAVLFRYTGISEAAVVGVPDEERGEKIVAFVVPENEATFEIRKLSEHLRASLSKYKLPDRIELRNSLPLTQTGKLHRNQIRADAMELFA